MSPRALLFAGATPCRDLTEVQKKAADLPELSGFGATSAEPARLTCGPGRWDRSGCDCDCDCDCVADDLGLAGGDESE